MTREFNTAGPMVASDHYLIPPLSRVDLDELLGLVRRKRYFVLHAPRQTGKTSTLLALRDLLNGGSEYACVYANFEVGQAARENVANGLRAMLGQLAGRAYRTLGDRTLDEIFPGALERFGPNGALTEALAQWAAAAPKPLVLLIDEIDSLVGDTLLTVLRQLRAGYDERPDQLPALRDPVRRAGRSRLPGPLRFVEPDGARRQRVQHPLGVAAARRLLRGGDAGAAGAAHRGDRAGCSPPRPWRRSGRARRASRGW